MNNLKELLDNKIEEIKKSITPIKKELPFDYKPIKRENQICEFLKIGNLIGQAKNVYPALLELNRFNAVAFKLNATNREEIHLAIQNYVLQIIERSTKGSVELSVVDIDKMGANLRALRKIGSPILTDFIAEQDQFKIFLDKQHSKSVSVITECLTHYNNLADYNNNSGHVVPFRIIVLADFPKLYSKFDKFETLLKNAKEAGIFFFMTYTEDIRNLSKSDQDVFEKILNHFTLLEEYGNPINDFYTTTKYNYKNTITNPINSDYTLQLDAKEISQENLDSLLNKLVGKITENESVGIGKGLRIPIGKSSGKTFHFTFGHESNCFNAIIGGQSGKGKTVLLNNIIAKGLEKYNSDELRFAIIDCSGVGFYEFEEATNIHLLCRSSSVETCMKAVKILEDELDRRENLFRGVGVSNIDTYINKTQNPLPRIICLLDEFHVLYTGGHRSDAYFDKILIDRIIRVGRKFGMHLIGSTQSLGGGIRRSILDNIPLRIALGMTTSQSNGFLDLKNDAATNLDVGKAVYNAKNGDNNANKFVNVNYIKEEDIERIITISNNNENTILNFETIKLA